MKTQKAKLCFVLVFLTLAVCFTATPAQAIRVLFQSWDTSIYLDKPFNSLEFEDPFAVGKYVQGYRILDWRDADYNKPGHLLHDEWTVSHPAEIDGNINEIWMRDSSHSIQTTFTVLSSVVSIHMDGDNNDGLAEVFVNDVLKAKLDMGTRNGSQTALIIVKYLTPNFHTIKVDDQGIGPSSLGDDVHTLGACALGTRKRFPNFWYPNGIIRIMPTWDYATGSYRQIIVPMGYWSGWWWWHHQCSWYGPWYGPIGRYWPWGLYYYPYWAYWAYWPYYSYYAPWWNYWKWWGGPYFWGYKKCLTYRYQYWRPVTLYWWGWYWDPVGQGNCVELVTMADEKDPAGGRILPVEEEVANNFYVDNHQFTVNGSAEEEAYTGTYSTFNFVEVGTNGDNLRSSFGSFVSDPCEVDAFMDSEIVQQLILNTKDNPTARVGFQYGSWNHEPFVAPLDLSSEEAYVQENTEYSYHLSLTVAPPVLHNTIVTVIPNSTALAVGSQLPGQSMDLIFTPSNWETPRTVTVHAVDNNTSEGGDVTAYISHNVRTIPGTPSPYPMGVSMTIVVQDDEPGGSGFPEGDLDKSGHVNMVDLSIMANDWLVGD